MALLVIADFRFFFRRLNLKSILIQAQTSRRKGEAVPCVRYQYARLKKPNGENLKSISSRGGVERPTLLGSGQKPRGKKGFPLPFKSGIMKKDLMTSNTIRS
ncbi:hypothetical protein [Streptococcus parasanguinis]|uniref:hypothetical protein n=1 Tax=Streptococcus parasanguinis TaxID=1318 RepID=UPI000C7E8152|nr:hypothetical protein [Streptococcus parasanguinis]PKZ95927.1 hypothetical protein CYK20_10710 [Streptococcus parasanguinis]